MHVVLSWIDAFAIGEVARSSGVRTGSYTDLVDNCLRRLKCAERKPSGLDVRPRLEMELERKKVKQGLTNCLASITPETILQAFAPEPDESALCRKAACAGEQGLLYKK